MKVSILLRGKIKKRLAVLQRQKNLKMWSSDSDFEFINQIDARKKRKFQNRPDYLHILDDIEFIRRFRLGKNSFILILKKIRETIAPSTLR